MKKVVLLINGNLGLRVLEFVNGRGDIFITGVVVNDSRKRSAGYLNEIDKILEQNSKAIPILAYERSDVIENKILEIFLNSEFGVSALFGHILSERLLNTVPGGIINLHPSLLPIGRGADPIPWSIIDQRKQGITIHAIDAGLDTGAVLSQKVMDTNIGMNSGEIYGLATKLLFEELVNIFSSWIDGGIETFAQYGEPVTSHKTKDLEEIRIINEHEATTVGDFLRKLQALTFSDGRKPVMRDESGTLWNIDIRITPGDDNIN